MVDAGVFEGSILQSLLSLIDIKRFLTSESTLKKMKNYFYFTLKTLFVLKIFKFLSSLLSHAEKLA